jgi:hypothetical protein
VEEEGTGGFWDMRKRIRREGQDQAGIEDGDGDGGGPGMEMVGSKCMLKQHWERTVK